MDIEQGWMIVVPDETVEDFGCRFWGGVIFSKSPKASVFFTDRNKAERAMAEIADSDEKMEAYIKDTSRLVPARVVEGSIRRISQSQYGLEEATDIYVIEVIPKSGNNHFEARIIVSDSPEDRVVDGNPFVDQELMANRAIATGEGATPEEAVNLMLRCLKLIKGPRGNEGEEWKG